MMRLQADENVPLDVVTALRLRGHDVAWVREDMPGAEDMRVLERAQRENRVVLTFDKDFGELAIRRQIPAVSGIILLRIAAPSSAILASMVDHSRRPG